jgi:ABC-type Fe3+-siderophore transport system permease subunit
MPEQHPYDYQRARYEAYVSEKKSLNDALLEISGRYTQWLCTLSGGALAVSITFLEKIAPHPLASTTSLLLLAWVALIVSLCTGLLSIHYSNNEVFNRIQSLDRDYANYRKSLDDQSVKDVPPATTNDHSSNTISVLNTVSTWAFIGGITFLCLFSLCNLDRQTADFSGVSKVALDVNLKYDTSTNTKSKP